MYVIGTAGHVDHGKTRLIQALTGMDPDRLPEEKARGMTIDLGFAWFEGPGGQTIGVVDVPGHERFIRNMAAGAWGLDCALLAVAADDGWMPQTDAHARVLAALGVPRIVSVITKIDAAAPGRAEAVRRDAAARCAGIFGFEPAGAAVSSLSGEGIQALKRLIIAELSRGSDRRRWPGALLYVDRVFPVKGAGLVATGTLKGGAIAAGDELVLFPAGERLRVKGLESYRARSERAEPGCRLALRLSRPAAGLVRGDCLAAPGLPVMAARECLALLRPLAGGLKSRLEVEVALGTAHRLARLELLPGSRPEAAAGRLVFESPLAMLAGQPFVLIRHGGSAILAGGVVVRPEASSPAERRALGPLLTGLPYPPSPADLAALELRLAGCLPAARFRFEPAAGADRLIEAGGWVFLAERFEEAAGRAAEAVRTPGGLGPAELAAPCGLPAGALAALLGRLVELGRLGLSSGRYLPAQPGPCELSGPIRALLERLERAGPAGFEPDKAGLAGAKRDLALLCRLGLAVSLGDGAIYYSRATYRALAAAVLGCRSAGARFSVQEAKQASGLSRKYVIPLLNKMESDGWVKREGDERVVASAGPRPD